jgi:hypothetical protein
MLKAETLESQLFKQFLENVKKAKGTKQDRKNRLRSSLPVLLIISLLRNCKFQYRIYLINNVSAETLTTGSMIPLATNSPPSQHE